MEAKLSLRALVAQGLISSKRYFLKSKLQRPDIYVGFYYLHCAKILIDGVLSKQDWDGHLCTLCCICFKISRGGN